MKKHHLLAMLCVLLIFTFTLVGCRSPINTYGGLSKGGSSSGSVDKLYFGTYLGWDIDDDDYLYQIIVSANSARISLADYNDYTGSFTYTYLETETGVSTKPGNKVRNMYTDSNFGDWGYIHQDGYKIGIVINYNSAIYDDDLEMNVYGLIGLGSGGVDTVIDELEYYYNLYMVSPPNSSEISRVLDFNYIGYKTNR